MTLTRGIVGVGVDLVHIPRIHALLSRQAARIRTKDVSSGKETDAHHLALNTFARKILHAREYERWSLLNEKAAKADATEEQIQSLAKVWSAKEAAFKAISSVPHPRLLTWHDAVLTYVEGTRRPALQYTPDLVQAWRESDLRPNVPPKLHLSISHDGEYVTSFVLAEEAD